MTFSRILTLLDFVDDKDCHLMYIIMITKLCLDLNPPTKETIPLNGVSQYIAKASWKHSPMIMLKGEYMVVLDFSKTCRELMLNVFTILLVDIAHGTHWEIFASMIDEMNMHIFVLNLVGHQKSRESGCSGCKIMPSNKRNNEVWNNMFGTLCFSFGTYSLQIVFLIQDNRC